ncbi:MAG TPA: hypothetical protein VIV61_06955, partial [Candidatus Ozemobacteraceae bacterium]
MQFQQAFVDRAELLGAHVAVVDPGEGVPIREETEGPDRAEQMRVAQLRRIERGTLVGAEQAA